MPLIISVAFTLFLFCFNSQTFAGPLLEPYGGYEYGGAAPKDTAARSGGTVRGPVAGARVGMGALGITLAADGRIMNGGQMDASVTSPVTMYDLGGALIFDFPAVPRVWFGYGIHQMNVGLGKAVEYDSFNLYGNYGKAGVGFQLFPYVYFNLEYVVYTYLKVRFNGGTLNAKISDVVSGNGDFRHTHSAGVATISIPLGW